MRTPLRPASRGAFGGANAMRARTRAGLAQRDRVELGRCCDLGVCHRLGAAVYFYLGQVAILLFKSG